MAKISIFGLGYVGAVSAGCFAKMGHQIIGVDNNSTKVNMINDGNSPIIEKDMPEIIKEAVKEGKLRATLDSEEAIQNSDISLVCVGTPSQLNGNLDLKYIRKVCEEIGSALKKKDSYHIVVCRSTMLPGSMRQVVIPTLEQYSEKRAGFNLGVCINPEFLREGTAVYDFNNPPKTVIGETDPKSGAVVADLYEGIEAALIRTEIETAEMVKYTDNVWHAAKVCFANEIGNICKELSIDGHKVMEIFCQDKKLNLSPYYMKPGFAFGGSCLPKDVRALTYKARTLDLDLPVLNSLLPSNQRQVERGLKMVMSKGSKKVGFLGFSFKAGTDDLRESPLVEVIERLLGKGYDIRVYDRNVNIAKIEGSNRDYILNHIPHISDMMVESVDQVLDHAETIVIGNNASEFKDIFDRLQDHHKVVDLVRVSEQKTDGKKYDGICW
ncbi:MAG: nucleotide sugar dehydrogenase [Planctomycetes bacterium]|nr:nucleotide sugar dehydrogenase [Planctomycetota bacterium]